MASARYVVNVKSAAFNAYTNNEDSEVLARGINKEYASKLEERLKRLEDSLKLGSSSTEQAGVSLGGHEENMQGGSEPPSTLLGSSTQDLTNTASTQASALSQDLTALHMSGLEDVCTSGPSNESPNNQLSGPPPKSHLAMHFIEFIRTPVKTDPFKMTLFSPQHSYRSVLSRLDDIVQEIREMYPLLDMGHFEGLLTPRESDDFVDTSARLAISNAALAIGVQWKTANSAFEELSSAPWAYFKTAFSTLPLLLLQGSNELAYEAILIMAIFMLGNADLHMASHLNSLASCETLFSAGSLDES
ncbi:hypothetical protein ACHAPT_008333 [Fusarium lateritium]